MTSTTPAPTTRPEGNATRPAGLTISTRIRADLAVIAVHGVLDLHSTCACREAVDLVLRRRPRIVVLDLYDATGDAFAVPVLGLVRRYLERCGVRLRLACVPEQLAAALERDGVASDYFGDPTAGVGAPAPRGRSASDERPGAALLGDVL